MTADPQVRALLREALAAVTVLPVVDDNTETRPPPAAIHLRLAIAATDAMPTAPDRWQEETGTIRLTLATPIGAGPTATPDPIADLARALGGQRLIGPTACLVLDSGVAGGGQREGPVWCRSVTFAYRAATSP